MWSNKVKGILPVFLLLLIIFCSSCVWKISNNFKQIFPSLTKPYTAIIKVNNEKLIIPWTADYTFKKKSNLRILNLLDATIGQEALETVVVAKYDNDLIFLIDVLANEARNWDQELIMVSGNTLLPIWTIKNSVEMLNPIIKNKYLYIPGFGLLEKINIKNGDLLWKYQMEEKYRGEKVKIEEISDNYIIVSCGSDKYKISNDTGIKLQ